MPKLFSKLNKISVIVFFTLIVVSVLIARWILAQPTLGYGDFVAFPVHPALLAGTESSVWKPVNMGVLESLNYDMIVASVFAALGGPQTGKSLFILFELTLTSSSFYLLARQYVQSPAAAVAASIVYLVNPVFLFQFTIGPFLLMGYALLPLVLARFLRFDKSRRVRDAILFIILFSIPNFFDHFAFEYEFLVLAIYLVGMTILTNKWSSSPRLVLVLLLAPLISFLAVLPSFSTVLFSQISTKPLGYTFYPEAFVSARINYAYGGASLLNLLRLLAGPSSTVARYLTFFSLIGAAGIAIPAIASLSFMSRAKRQAEVIKYATGIALIFIVGVIYLMKMGLVPVNPLVAVFEDPQRLMFTLALTLCILLALGLDSFRSDIGAFVRSKGAKRGGGRKLSGVMYASLLFFLLESVALFNAGGLKGDIGLFGLYRADSVTMPHQYADALQWITSRQSTESFFRTLWLPTDFYTFHLITPSDPFILGSWPGSEKWDYPNIELTNTIFAMISGNSTTHLGLFLGPLGVKYVIVPDLVNSEEGIRLVDLFTQSKGIIGSASAFTSFLDGQSDLKRVHQSEGFVVYEILDTVPHNSLFHSSLLIIANGTDPLGGMQYVFDFPGFSAKTQLLISSKDVPNSELRSVQQNVNLTLYMNPPVVSVNGDRSRLFDLTDLKDSTLYSAKISSFGTQHLEFAVESRSSRVNASVGSQEVAVKAGEATPPPFHWYYG